MYFTRNHASPVFALETKKSCSRFFAQHANIAPNVLASVAARNNQNECPQ
jgi:hypothetical protein